MTRRFTAAAASVVLLLSGGLLEPAPVSATQSAPAVSAAAAGTLIYATPPAQANGDGTIWQLAPGGAPSRVTAGERPVLSPDGTQLAFVRGATDRSHGDLYVRSLASGAESLIAGGSDSHAGYSWKTGSALLFDAACSFSLATIASDETATLATAPGGRTCPDADPVIDPADGSTWWSAADGLDELPVGGARTHVANTAAGAVLPTFDAAGKHAIWLQLAAPSGADLVGNLDTIAPGGAVRAVTDLDTTRGDGVRGSGTQSSDGLAVLAPATVGGVSGVWQFPYAGGRPQLLSTPAAGAAGADPGGAASKAAGLAGVVGGYAETPLPQDDTASTPAGRTVTIDVLANDLGPFDQGTLTSSAAGVTVLPGAHPKLSYAAPAGAPTTTSFDYSVCATGSVGCASATVSVAVGQTVDDAAHPVLSFGALPTLTPGTAAPVTLHATNPGNAAFAADVSAQADRPGSALSLSSTSSFWSCSSVGALAHCAATTIVPQGALPDLIATVTDAPGPQTACPAPTTGACLPVAAWVGQPTATDRSASVPAAVTAQLPVAAALLTATIQAAAPFVARSRASWNAHVGNRGTATAGGTASSVTFTSETPISDVTGTGWTCVAGSTTTVTCTRATPLEVGADSVLAVGVTPAAAGQATLTLTWGSGDGAIRLAQLSTPVAAPTPVVDAAIALTHDVPAAPGTGFVAGQTGRYTVTVTDAGTTVLSTGVGVMLTLPDGVTATSSAGKGWSCALGAPTTCTFSGPSAAPGAALSPLTVLVAIADTAVSGTATAVVTATGDHNAANDSASDETSIHAPGGPAGISIDTAGPGAVEAGTSAAETFTVTQIAGLPAADRLRIQAYVPAPFTASVPTGTGWSCSTVVLPQRTLLSCLAAAGTGAGALPPVSTTLSAPNDSAGASGGMSFEVIRLRGVSSQAPAVIPIRTLTVTPILRAALRIHIIGVSQLTSGSTPYVVAVSDTGLGALTSVQAVRITAPDGASIGAVSSAGWSCSAITTGVVCVPTVGAIPAGAGFPGLTLPITGTPGVASNGLQLTAAVIAGDAHGTVLGSSSFTVQPPDPGDPALVVQRSYPSGRPGLTGGVFNETLVVRNSGSGATGGRLTLSEQFPAGFSATGAGSGWTCTMTGRVLTCTRPAAVDTGAFAPGALAPAVAVVGTPRLSGLHGTESFSASAMTAGTISGALQIPAATTPVASLTSFALTVSQIEKLIRATEMTSLSFGATPFTRGQSTTATLTVTGTSLPDQPQGVGMLLPAGVTLGAAAPFVVTVNAGLPGATPATATGTPGTCALTAAGNGLGCGLPAITVPQALMTAATVARLNGGTIGFTATVTVPVTVSPNPGQSLAFSDGFAVPPVTPPATATAAAAALTTDLAGRGANALGLPDLQTVGVTGFTADAGAAQRLSDTTPDVTGALVPTRVQLTSRTTTDPGRTLGYGWTQLSGPAVTWKTSTAPRLPAIGTFAAYGQQVAFAAPKVAEQTILTFSVEVGDGSGHSDATTTVTLLPTGDRPPIVTGIDVLTSTGGGKPRPLSAGEVPSAGQVVRLVAHGSDPDGDPLTWTYTLQKPTDRPVTFTPVSADGSTATFVWPADTTLAEVQASASDGHLKSLLDLAGSSVAPHLSLPPGTPVLTGTGGPTAPVLGAALATVIQTVASSTSVVIGKAPAPLGASVTGPAGTPAVTSLAQGQTTTLTEAAPTGSTVAWTQTAGPPGAIPASATGPNVTVTGPSPAPGAAGTSVTIRATVTLGSGTGRQTSTRDTTIALVAPQPAVAAITGGTEVAPSGNVTLQAPPTGGTAPFTYLWNVGAPATGSSTTSTIVVSVAAAASGNAPVTVTITDATGAVTTATQSLLVGTPSDVPTDAPPDPSNPSLPGPCDLASAFGSIYSMLHNGAKPTLHIGPLALVIDQSAGASGPCSSSLTINLTNASANLGPVSIAHLNAVITSTGITLSSAASGPPASVTLPSSWGLASGSIIAGKPLTLAFATPTQVSGGLHFDGLAFLKAPPSVTNASTTITFGSGSLALASSASVLHGTASLTSTISYATPGTFTVAFTGTGLTVFGTAFDATGSVSSANGHVTSAAKLQLHAGSGVDLPGGVHLSTAVLSWDGTSLKADGTGTFGKAAPAGSGVLDLSLSGVFADADDWTLTGKAVPEDDPYRPLPGLSLTKASTSFNGTITSKAGAISFSLAASLSGTVTLGALSLSSLQATVANTAPPAACGGVVVADSAGKIPVWLSLAGAGTVALPGGSNASFSSQLCLDPAHLAFAVTSTASLGSYQPLAAIPFTLDSVSLSASRSSAGVVALSLAGQAHVKGASIGGSVTLVGGNVVLDANGDLSSLGTALPRGHIIYSTAPTGTKVDLHDATIADDDGSSPTAPTGTTPVPASTLVSVDNGFSALGAFQLPQSLTGFLTSKLAFSSPPTVIVKATLSGGTPTLTATLRLGSASLTLFGDPSDATQTSLRVTSLTLQLSASGSFGFGANGLLNLPAGDPTGGSGGGTPAAPSQQLGLTVALTVDVTGPSITLALYVNGNYDDAVGIRGLDLQNVAIQGGIDFASAPPTPSIGFGATVNRLPDPLANDLGIAQPSNGGGTYGEAISFVVNISTTHPIFDLTLGTHDGNYFLRPLTFLCGATPAASCPAASALEIDDASLVLAPNGGQVGPYTFGRGAHLAFDASVLHDNVSVAADLSLDPTNPSLTADLNVGAVSLAGISFRQTTAHLSATPTSGFDLKFSGGLALGSATLAATADVSAGITQGLHFSFATAAQDVPLGFATLNNLSLTGAADFGGTGVDSEGNPFVSAVPVVSIQAAASLSVLGVAASVTGSISVSPAGITAASLTAELSNFHAGPLTVSAAPGATCGADRAPTGPCVTVGVDLLSAVPLTIALEGSVQVAGFTASFSGGIDGKGVYGTGTLDLKSLGSATITGEFYLGTQLGGVTETDSSGVTHSVQQGDFKVTGGLSVSAAGFTVAGTVTAGHLGSTVFLAAHGQAGLLGTAVTVDAALSYAPATGVDYSFAGTADVTLSGYHFGHASITITPSGGSLSAAFSLAGFVSSSVSGSISITNGTLEWSFTGAVTLTVGPVHATGTASFYRQPNGFGGEQTGFSFAATIGIGSVATINVGAQVGTDGAFCAFAIANYSVITGTVTYCTDTGFTFDLKVGPYDLADFTIPSVGSDHVIYHANPSFNSPDQWYLDNHAEASASGSVSITIYDNAPPAGSFSFMAQVTGCIFSKSVCLGPIGFGIAGDPLSIPPTLSVHIHFDIKIYTLDDTFSI